MPNSSSSEINSSSEKQLPKQQLTQVLAPRTQEIAPSTTDLHVNSDEILPVLQPDTAVETQGLVNLKDSAVKEILGSEEFMIAVMACVDANTAHNDHNKFQNIEAIKIADTIKSKAETANSEIEFGKKIKSLVEYAAKQKTLDARYSYFFDGLRLAAATTIFAMSNSSIGANPEDEGAQQTKDNALFYASLATTALQVCASAFTSYHGYQASISGHFAQEAAQGYKQTIQHITSKSGLEATTGIESINLAASHDSSHQHSASSNLRNAGSVLNVASIAIGGANAVAKFQQQPFDHIGETLIATPILSSIGKTSSALAANKREDEVKKTIDEANQVLAEFLTKSCEKSDLQDSNKEEFVLNIKTNLRKFSEVQLETAQGKRDSASISSKIMNFCKQVFTYTKDSIYGIPYNFSSRLSASKADETLKEIKVERLKNQKSAEETPTLPDSPSSQPLHSTNNSQPLSLPKTPPPPTPPRSTSLPTVSAKTLKNRDTGGVEK